MRFIDSSGVVFDCPVSFGSNGTFTPPWLAATNYYTVSVHLDTIVSATARVGRFIVPYGGAGSIVQIDAVNDVATATGSLTLTSAIGATPVTSGVITMVSGTAAGVAGTCNPSAANTVGAGNVVKVTVGGANTGDGRSTITFTMAMSKRLHEALLAHRKREPLGPWVVARWMTKKRCRARLDQRSGYKWIDAAARKATGRKGGPHLMRHTSITNLAEVGVDPADIQSHARHKHYSTIEKYLHVCKVKGSRRAAARLDEARSKRGSKAIQRVASGPRQAR